MRRGRSGRAIRSYAGAYALFLASKVGAGHPLAFHKDALVPVELAPGRRQIGELGDPANNKWSVRIDGSDIGLANTDIDAFEWRPDGSQLISLDTAVTLPGIPFTVEDTHIVRFIPTRLGATTEGRFEFFFDGTDVGLDSDLLLFSGDRLGEATRGP